MRLHRRSRVVALVVLFAALPACDRPGEAAPTTVSVVAEPSTIASGDSARIRVALVQTRDGAPAAPEPGSVTLAASYGTLSETSVTSDAGGAVEGVIFTADATDRNVTATISATYEGSGGADTVVITPPTAVGVLTPADTVWITISVGELPDGEWEWTYDIATNGFAIDRLAARFEVPVDLGASSGTPDPVGAASAFTLEGPISAALDEPLRLNATSTSSPGGSVEWAIITDGARPGTASLTTTGPQ